MNAADSTRWIISISCICVTSICIGIISISLGVFIQNDVMPYIVFIALSTIPAMALMGLIIFRILNRIFVSIEAASDAAIEFAAGNFDRRIVTSGNKSTLKLEKSFNHMASALAELIHDLSGERDKLSAMLETMADGVIVINSDGITTMINQSAESLLNLSSKEAVGYPLTEKFRDYELSTLISKSLETNKMTQKEFHLIRQHRFVSVISTPLQGVDHGSVLLTLQDLTDIRRLDTTRREFVTNVSHELRSPLASVKALTDTLNAGAMEEPKTAQEFLVRIDNEIDRMTTLVNDLLDLSKLESGHQQINLIPISLWTLIDESIHGINSEATSRNIDINNHVPEDFPQAVGDKDKLGQVLANLLGNALKATPDEGTISINGQISAKFVQISVSDTGIGIPKDHIPHVFERFYKVDRSRGEEGSGLGLAIVKHIIHAHGGDISITSQEGNGSTFSFTLSKA